MRLSIISFTQKGMLLSERIQKEWNGEGEVRLYTKCRACMDEGKNPAVSAARLSVREWAGEQMKEGNALLFIGACGIAVRSIAPFLKDKLQDVPVLVMDENGEYVVPILSGHMGGANELAGVLAGKTGARPVITTATDINGAFAVDVFARKNNLSINSKDGIARVSAKALAGEEIRVSAGAGCTVCPPKDSGVRMTPYPPAGFVDIVISSQRDIFDAAVVLCPREYVIGIGCKRGKSAHEIGQFIEKKLGENKIRTEQIFALASIWQKREEAGILGWCRRRGVPFLTYPAEELKEIGGDFSKSAFVEEQVGVDNVCERAAIKACGGKGKLIVRKCAENGMTAAIAKRDWEFIWD